MHWRRRTICRRISLCCRGSLSRMSCALRCVEKCVKQRHSIRTTPSDGFRIPLNVCLVCSMQGIYILFLSMCMLPSRRSSEVPCIDEMHLSRGAIHLKECVHHCTHIFFSRFSIHTMNSCANARLFPSLHTHTHTHAHTHKHTHTHTNTHTYTTHVCIHNRTRAPFQI